MNGRRARAIRNLRAELRARTWAMEDADAIADCRDRLDAAIAGGPGWRARSQHHRLHLDLGKATWWGSESVFNEVVSIPIHCEAVEIDAQVEVPRDEGGRRVHRTARNAFYPPLVEVQTPESLTLHAETARELAAALIAAADACDEADRPAYETREESGYQAPPPPTPTGASSAASKDPS